MGERGWECGRRMLALVGAKICLPSIWDHISRLRECLVVGVGPCSAPWSSFGGLGLRADWHGIEAIRMGIHMSVVVSASVSPRRWVCAAVDGRAGRHGWVGRSSQQVSRPVTAQLRYGVACAGQPSTKSGGQLIDEASCWRKSSQLPFFLRLVSGPAYDRLSGLASPYCIACCRRNM